MRRLSARARALGSHRETWGEPTLLVRAPGRVNLIGEHTDYNDGFVLPMALPFDTVVAVSPAPDGRSILRSEGFGEVRLGEESAPWAAHVETMVEVMAADGIVAPAWRAAVASDIPSGASLSSSAAIEVAMGWVVATMAGRPVDPIAIARYGQQVETRLLGGQTGIMDQLISATAVAGSASLIDCRTLESTPVRIPLRTAIVVMDTLTRRRLVESEFSARMASCRRAAELIGVPALRDADRHDVATLRPDHEVEWRRAEHVVSENARTLAAADAMVADDAAELGALMTESHRSLRDQFAVSSDALDTIVAAAESTVGCFGARMTGGGFAGCAVALVDVDETDRFLVEVASAYERGTGTAPRLWGCEASAGAALVNERN